MHSSGVCAHLQGSGCASASYLGEPGNTLPEQRFSLPVGAPLAGRKPHRKAESGAPAALPTAVPDGRTDRQTDGQTVPWPGALAGAYSLPWPGAGGTNSGRTEQPGHSTASELGPRAQQCITPQQHHWHSCGGKEGPCAPRGDTPSHPAALPAVPPCTPWLPSLDPAPVSGLRVCCSSRSAPQGRVSVGSAERSGVPPMA